MAIVIEEEKRSGAGGSGLLNALLWIALIGGVAFGAYYVFFQKPEIIDLAVPNDFKNTEQISRLELHPDEVLQSPQFTNLRSYITPPATPESGKANPFLGF
jgi:hypothetical protein